MNALDTILHDVSSALEVTAEIDSAKRPDGTLKTWYFSTNFRSTGGSETPANTEFLPFLVPGGTLGPLSQSLSEDVLFAGLASENPGTLTLIQSNLDTDQLSELNDYVFAGYEIRLKIGRSSDLYAAFVTFRTVTVSIDPIVQLTSDGLQASFQLSSALKRMIEETLIVRKYLGIPHCLRLSTPAGKVTVTKQAGHDVSRFTIGVKFRVAAIPAENHRIWTKHTSTTDSQWFIAILNTTGVVRLTASSGGVADISVSSASSVCDGILWHSLIYSRDNDKSAWVMIDGVETIITPTGVPNLSNANLIFGESLTAGSYQRDLVDARYLDRYMTPDEARGYFSVRSNGDDLNCIGLWRFDDNLGATANDSGSLNADGAIAGVLNTAYSWQPSDLGEPELAGSNYPINIGNVLNARAHLIDTNRQRYRGNDGSTNWYSSGSNTSLVVRSQGTVLTPVTDYNAPASGGDGVFQMTSQEAEPVTYDHLMNGVSEYLWYTSYIAYNLLSTRTRIAGADIANVDPLTVLCPWPSGYHTDKDTTAQQALSEIIGGSGLHYRESNDGSLWLDMLLPPTGYGPYGDPCLDFRGGQAGRVVWGDIADISGSFTLACWVKLQVLDQTAYDWGSSEPNEGTMFIINKGGLSGNYSIYFQAVGVDAGKIKSRTGTTTLSTAAGVIPDNSWYFVASVFDIAADTMKIYIGKKGAALYEVASGSNTGTPSTNSHSLMVGDSGNRFPWMSVAGVHVWNVAKSKAQLETLMITPPVGNDSNLLFYAPMNEGEGNPVDAVSLTSGTVTYTGPNGHTPEWAPKLIINLDETPSVKLTDFHHIHPAWDVRVDYNKNRYPMDNSDIDTGVSQNNRLALTREGLTARLENTTIKNRFKNAKRVSLDSPITDQESAQRLLRVIANRFGTDVYVGTLKFPSGLNISRIACGLEIGDEIGIIATIPSQLQTPRSFRVVSRSPNPLKLETTISFMG